jgi:serine/threonine protein kinase
MVAMIGGYQIVRQLGRGGMGTVWLAEDSSGQRVALKVINAELAREPEFRERFRQEVQAARRVRRFCTAPVLDAGLEGNPLWVATDFIDGPTVQEAVSAYGPLRGADLDALAVGIATALTAIHEARLIHRDLKPSNVLLSPVGPRVIDFGIARALDATVQLTLSGTAIGTPGYIAPELLAGSQPLPAADVFSWGAVVAYAGTGRLPFAGATRAEINHRVQHADPDLAGLDPQLRQTVARALAKDPATRPAVPQLLAELTGSPTPQPDPGNSTRLLPTRLAPRPARRLALYAGIGAVLLAAVIATAFALTSREQAAGSPGSLSKTTSPPATVTTSPTASRLPATPSPPTPQPGAQPPSSASGPIINTFSSGLCIDTDGPQGPGIPVLARDCGNYSGQVWSYSPASHHLVNSPSGLCLDTDAPPAVGVDAVLNPCGYYTGQLWQYDASTGHFVNLPSGLCLDTAGPPANNVNLILDPCGNYTGQGWHT